MAIDSSIRNLIDLNGYIRVDDLMKVVLSQNQSSYYKTINFIGNKGDFITSPEISQLFGETIALWVIEKWQEMGSPKEFALVELGPGRGILMRDLLKVTKLVPDFFNNVKIFFLEINPNFIKQQKEHMSLLFSKSENKVTWITNLDQLPTLPTIFIANEFFDALPIKQYNKIKDKWYEVTFVADPNDGMIKNSKVNISEALESNLNKEHPNCYDGAIIEESPESLFIVRLIAEHIKKFSGSGLFIDYGYNIKPSNRTRYQYNSTLQAIKNHKYHPIIESLGEADLSAHVDFNALTKAAEQKAISDILISSQRDFLFKYGILLRLERLQKQNDNHSQNLILAKQVERLTSEKQMGLLFKVMEIRNY